MVYDFKNEQQIVENKSKFYELEFMLGFESSLIKNPYQNTVDIIVDLVIRNDFLNQVYVTFVRPHAQIVIFPNIMFSANFKRSELNSFFMYII